MYISKWKVVVSKKNNEGKFAFDYKLEYSDKAEAFEVYEQEKKFFGITENKRFDDEIGGVAENENTRIRVTF